MTETQIREAVSEMQREFRKDLEFARFCRDAAPGYLTGCLIFGAVLWEPSEDRAYQQARLELARRGYVA